MINVDKMNRTEVIKELSGIAHPSWFHSLLDWETQQLKALLTYYRNGGDFPTKMVGKIYRTKGVGDEQPVVMYDWSTGGVILIDHSGFMSRIRKFEITFKRAD